MNQSPPPSVNFYILPDSNLQNRFFFVFRLLEKSFDKKLLTLVIGANQAQLNQLDKLIWTAKPARFIAHEILTAKITQPLPTILLTENVRQIDQLNFAPQVVIDLSYDATPLDFPKIMLVANQHAEILPNARMKYQAYINTGIKPSVYKINEKMLTLL